MAPQSPTLASKPDIFDPELDMEREEVAVIRLDILRWTQQELADTLRIARTTVARWETGKLAVTRIHALALRQLVLVENKRRRAAKAKPVPEFNFGRS